MTNITTRMMTIDDVDAVHEIELGCFTVPWTHEAFVKEITDNSHARYMVLCEDDVVVAYAGTWFVLNEAHITNIAVQKNKQGLGYGEKVTAALMQLAADSGMVWMTLEVRRSNIVAQNLYRKLGFTDVGYRKRYYEDNKEDALIMVCEKLPEGNPENDPFLIYEDDIEE